jgi:hypothetical protein
MHLQKNVELPQKPGPCLFAFLLALVAILSIAATVVQAMYIDRGLPATSSAAPVENHAAERPDR